MSWVPGLATDDVVNDDPTNDEKMKRFLMELECGDSSLCGASWR